MRLIVEAGIDAEVLERGRNARTGGPESQISLIRGVRRRPGRDAHSADAPTR